MQENKEITEAKGSLTFLTKDLIVERCGEGVNCVLADFPTVGANLNANDPLALAKLKADLYGKIAIARAYYQGCHDPYFLKAAVQLDVKGETPATR